MLNTKKDEVKQPKAEEKAQVVDITFDEGKPPKGYVEVAMKLFKRPNEKNAQAWTIKGNSLVQINGKARKLCEDNGRRFPQDVEVWEVI